MAKQIDEIKKVKYRSSIIVHENGDKEYEYDFVSVETGHTKRYNNALCLLMGINGCAHHLIEWISNNMTEGGYVHNNDITRKSFIGFHTQHRKSNKSYGHDAVNKGFKKLSDEGFLVPINKGTYKVNPLMYFSKEEDDRIKSIKYTMEFKAGVETKILREISKR